MKYKIKKIEREDKYLKVYVKKPLFKDMVDFIHELDYEFLEKNKWESYLGTKLNEHGDVILTFVLRNMEEFEPYIKYGMGKQVCEEIYNRLNEIQYMLKFSVSKAKVRRKVKDCMKYLENTIMEDISDKIVNQMIEAIEYRIGEK